MCKNEKKDTEHELTPELYKALSLTGYPGKSMKKDSDVLLMNGIKNNLGYKSIGDKSSKQKTFLLTIFLKELQKQNLEF